MEDAGKIERVRYRPSGEYFKDHCLFRHDGLWHLFGSLGKAGCSWMNAGSEEVISHIVSPDLVDWQVRGNAVEASHIAGRNDEDMAVAPFVVRGDDGKFIMFYSGWRHPHRLHDFSYEGHHESIYMAVSEDLYHWDIPNEVAASGLIVTDGDPIEGRDPHVIRDDMNDRWLLYYTDESLGKRPPIVGVAESTDLWTWRNLGPALVWNGTTRPFNPTESSFVLRHPVNGKFVLFLYWDYSISDDPTHFEGVDSLPFPCGLDYPPNADRDHGIGWASVGIGFAREIIEHENRWYMSCVMGRDGETEIGFVEFTWTDDFIRLCSHS